MTVIPWEGGINHSRIIPSCTFWVLECGGRRTGDVLWLAGRWMKRLDGFWLVRSLILESKREKKEKRANRAKKEFVRIQDACCCYFVKGIIQFTLPHPHPHQPQRGSSLAVGQRRPG